MSQVEVAVVEQMLAGGGEMGLLMRSLDWSKTPVGPVSTWPQSLRTAVTMILDSKFPMALAWGRNYTFFYNDNYRPILGANKHPGAMGRPIRESFPEIWDFLDQMFGQVMQGQSVGFDNLLLFLDRNGYLEECFFTFSYSPFRDEDGQVGGVLVTVTETTQRVLSERRLHTLHDLGAQAGEGKTAAEAGQLATEILAHNSADLPFALFYLLDAARQQAHLLGTAGVEPGTPTSPRLIEMAGSAEEKPTWPLAQVAQTGQITVVEHLSDRFSVLPAGPWPEPPHTALVLPIAAPGQNNLAGFLVAGVSSRRALDDDYHSFFKLVAGHIATAVANARAYEAERQRAEVLAELDRAKTTFFSNISHEFRTPLTLLLGPLEDALAGTLGPLLPSQREGLELAQRNSLRLLKLVNTLLDFSRIEASRIQASFQPTDLATFTAELASVFRSAIERAGLRLSVECPPLPEPIYVDRDMWEKIVLNLLSNAFKFTHEGEIAVTLQARPTYIELRVSDTGTGIPDHELPHIFERFYRVRDARARTHEGSGIGLALVQELIRLHRGQIEVVSKVDQGTTFTVQIPSGTAHLPPDQIETQPALASTALGPKLYVEEALRWLPDTGEEVPAEVVPAPEELLGPTARPPATILNVPGARIVLAEDNADMRDYLRRLLAAHWTVEAVADGAAALAVIRERTPDLVLTDVMMPGLDGLELLRELRADPRSRTIPIILLSARAGEDAAIEGLQSGADDYLTKPFSARELLARVGAHLALARQRQQTEGELRAAYAQAESEQRRVITILESISDAFVALDREYRNIYLNQRAEEFARRLTGKSKVEFLGQSIWEMIPELFDSRFGREYRRVLTEQVSSHFEEFFPQLNTWFEVYVYPSEEGLSIYFRDITERKQTEKTLHESEERYRSLVQATTSIVWVADASRAFTSPQPGWEAYTGQTWEEYQGWGWLNALHSDDRAGVKAGWEQAVTDGTVYEVGERLWHAPSGAYRHVNARGAPVLNPDGTIREWVGTMSDVHERKQAEELIHFQASLLDQIQNAVVVNDLEGKIIYWNNFAERLYGWKAEEAVGQDVFQWIAPSLARQRRNEAAMVLEQSGQWESEIIAQRKDGTTMPVFITVSAIRDALGQVVAFVGISVDITARKREEAAQRLLAEAGSVLASSLDYQTILYRVARLTLPNLGDSCNIYMLSNDHQIQQMAEAHVDPDKEELLREMSAFYQPDFNNSKSFVGQVIRTGQPLVANVTIEAFLELVPDNQRLQDIFQALAPQSILVLPLLARGRVLGALTLVYSDSGRRHGSDEVALAEELARRVALALDNARLYEAEQKARQAAEQSAERITALQAITAAFSEALTPAQVARVVVEQGVAVLGAKGGSVALLDESGTTLETVDFAGYAIEIVEKWRSFPITAAAPVPEAVRTGEPILVESLDALLARYPHLASQNLVSYQARAALPLMIEGRTLGGIGFSFVEAQEFSSEDRTFMLALAQQCAQALERARLYEAEQQARFEAEAAQEHLVFMAEATRVLVASLDYQSTLQRVVRLALPLLADYCLLHLLEADGQLQAVAEAHHDPHRAGLLRELSRRYRPAANDPTNLIDAALQTQEPVLMADLSEADALASDEKLGHLLRQLGAKSVMILPLLAHSQTLGALTLVWAESDRRYGELDLPLAEELARRAALAVDNARLYRHAQQLNAELEQRVVQRTGELEATNKILKDEIGERQRSHARFVTIFHNSPIPISVSTWAEGRFLDVNDSFLAWLGYEREEVIGRTSSELGFQTDAELRPKILEMLHDQGALRNLEKNYYTRSRQLRKAIVSTEMIELEDETCLLTVFYDVTEREQLAAELAEIQHRLLESLERERMHLAQELHDGPVQDLYGVSFSLIGLKDSLTDEADLSQLAAAQSGIQQVIQMLRATFTDLRPPALAPYGLEKAILSHAEQFQQRHPELKLSLNLTPDGQELPEWIRLALFRIYREALNNIIRHAQAEHVWLEFSLDAAQVVLAVKDDGQGFEVPQRWVELVRQGHLGLVGIAERVEAMAGQLQISSTPGAGTLIRVSVPRSKM